MTVTEQIEELTINRINSRSTSKLTSLINGDFSSLLKEESSKDESENQQEDSSNLNGHMQIIQNKAYLNKIIIENVA